MGCCLYLISEGESGPVKVGVANRPHARIGELQTGNPKPLRLADWWLLPDRPSAMQAERMIHDEMAPYRLVGEWIDADEFGMSALIRERLEELYQA